MNICNLDENLCEIRCYDIAKEAKNEYESKIRSLSIRHYKEKDPYMRKELQDQIKRMKVVLANIKFIFKV